MESFETSKKSNRTSLLKIGHYLSIAFYDTQFSLLFILITLKLLLFMYLIELPFRGFFPALGGILMAFSLSIVISNKLFRFTYLSLIYIFISLIFFTDALYFKYFGAFVSLYDLHQAHQLGTISDIVIQMVKMEVLFILDLLFLPFTMFKLKTTNIDYSKKLKSVFLLLIFSIYLIISPFFSHKYFSSVIWSYYHVSDYGIINYHLIDFYNYFSSKVEKSVITKKDIDLIKKWYEHKSLKTNRNDFTGIAKGANLIIIQVESLQNFVINKKINDREITPTLNRLAKNGIYFNNIYDQTASGNTSDATFLLNTSLFPLSKGAVSFIYPENCFDSLPKIFKSKGYSTAVMHALHKDFWNMSKINKTIGFQNQFYEDSYKMTELLVDGFLVGLSDKEFFRQSIEKLKRLDSPYYALMLTLSSHAPFAHITKDMVDFPLGELEGEIIGYYLRAIHYTDSAIGEFLEELSKNNMLSNTVIVIFGDHRARLSEKELRRIGIEDMSELRKIPLIISIPDKKLGQIKDIIGGHIDLAPTILNLFGLEASDKFFLGRDLLSNEKGFVIFRDGSFKSDSDAIDYSIAKKMLTISDVIIEKDIIPLIRGSLCE